MKIVNFQIKNKIVLDMIDLYNDINNISNDSVLTVPYGFNGFSELILNSIGYDPIINLSEELSNPIDIESTNNKVVVGFSSGFDSVYNSLKLLSCGYEPVLFHVKSLNKSYPDEFNKSISFAKDFGFDIVVLEVEDNNNPIFIDNPMKNQMILSLMIEYGTQNNINKFAMGNNVNEKISECRVQYGISDSIEMFTEYRNGISKYFNNLEFFDILETKSNAYKFVGENFYKAFENVNSCITPHRFKKHLNKLNSNKFNITPLSDTRCMSCYKCAIEAILLDYNNIVEYPDDYIEHSYDIIRKKSDTIFTTKIANKKSKNSEILERLIEC